VARNRYGTVTAVQKTFLQYPSAKKAMIEKPKLTYGDMEGGSFVKVNDPVDPKKRIAVFAEGLETALTIAQALHNQIPCYATLGIWNFTKIPLFMFKDSYPIICADHDCSENTKTRDKRIQMAFQAAGWNSNAYKIIRPDSAILPDRGSDYNDVLRKFHHDNTDHNLEEVRNDLITKIPELKPMASAY